MADALVRVEDLAVHYPITRERGRGHAPMVVHAVDGVSFEIASGETLGLVGESGSGKTTTGRAILRRVPITRGSVHFGEKDITHTKGEELRLLRRNMQLVFQDPYGSLNPRMRVGEIVAEPLVVHGLARNAREARPRVAELLAQTGLPPDAINRYPHAFSGGQRQRIGIARALSVNPQFIVADEPVAALDTSIQAQVVNLLKDLQDELGLAYLFIAHDLSVVRHISHRIAIMYAGKLVEMADRDEIFDAPSHPYTRSLLSAIPLPDPVRQSQRERIVLTGEPPDQTNPQPGCRFATRCPNRRAERCDTETPALREIGPGHHVACHWAEELLEHGFA